MCLLARLLQYFRNPGSDEETTCYDCREPEEDCEC